MHTRRLGRTELWVSEIGLGGIKFPGVDQKNVTRLVNEAIDSGINIIDTARAYGDSEEKIGRALEGRRGEVILSTKSQARDADGMRRDIETSLRNLRTDYIDIYLTHNLRLPEVYEKATSSGGALEALEQAREEGLIGHPAISCHRYHDTFKKAISSGRFDVIMVAYNILNDELMDEEVMPMAKEHDLGTLVMKPLGGGVLAEVGDKLKLEGQGLPERPIGPAGAIRFVLENPYADCAMVGMKAVEELREDIRAASPEHRYTREEVAALQDAVRGLGREMCRGCGYCQPCPNGILIPIILRHLFYGREMGLEEWARGRYSMVEIKADECERCGECEEKCPYDLPVVDLLEEAHRLFG
ncbi:MAG: aldo/keto reductase [Candidatus Brocadiia bacterium]